MGREVMPLTAQHLEEAARVLGQAFRDDPFWLVLFEGLDEDERQRQLTWFFAASLFACLRRGWPLEVRDQNRTVATATIYPPKAYPLPLLEEVAVFAKCLWHVGPFRRNTWTTMVRAAGMLNELLKEHPQPVHYYWEFIGVRPDRQGQGIGSLITKALLQRADQEQVGCYLETANPRNVPPYERLGFQTVGEREILGARVWFMWRDPQQPSSLSTPR